MENGEKNKRNTGGKQEK